MSYIKKKRDLVLWVGMYVKYLSSARRSMKKDNFSFDLITYDGDDDDVDAFNQIQCNRIQ